MDNWSRGAALTGAAFTILVAAGAVLSGSTPGDTASGRAVIAFYLTHAARQKAAVAFLAFAFVALIFFASWLRVYFRRQTSQDGLAVTALAGVAVLATGQTIGAGLGWTLSAAPGQLQPAAAQALNAAANDMVITSAAGWFIFSVAIGLAIIRSKALPSWLGWVSVVIAIVVVTPAEFAAFLAFAVWTLIVSVLTWRRSRTPGSAGEKIGDAVLAS
ncbi:MAG: hypothetical protein JO016_16045 [Actinobacteria bacterium]|nr:hypothetical protein [Actinomycetota bacterium]